MIDDVEMPLGFRQLQAAAADDWTGTAATRNSSFWPPPAGPDLTRRRRGVADPLPPIPSRRQNARPPASRGVALTRFCRRYPRSNPRCSWRRVSDQLRRTSADAALTPRSLGAEAGYPIADAFRWFERYLSFELHDTTECPRVIRYSASYFVIFPVLCLYVAWASRAGGSAAVPGGQPRRGDRLRDQPAVLHLLPGPRAVVVHRSPRPCCSRTKSATS
jgi:hypothetical protein